MKSFDLRFTPFACAGSPNHLGLENFGEGRRVVYETTRRSVWLKAMGGWGSHFFRLQLIRRGQELDYHTQATPSRLDLLHDDGAAAVVFADPHTLMLKISGAAMRLESCHVMGWQSQLNDRALVIYDHAGACTHHFRLESAGRLTCQPDLSMTKGGKQGARQCGYAVTVEPEGDKPVILALRTALHEERFEEPLADFHELWRSCQREYADWQQRRPIVEPRYEAAADFAWHMLWNQRIDPVGHITRPAILMSRHWMHCVWPWDACFSALAVAAADPQLAWNQVLMHFDHQLPNGQIPDAIHDGHASYGWVKPPIQGWTISHLLRELPADANAPYLREAYDKLSRWTQWWYDCRDFDRDGACHYMHGNDSGWDNATIFDVAQPVEAPDLSAHLVLQCEALADLARRLNRPAEAMAWDAKAMRQRQILFAHQVENDRFIARDQSDQPIAATDSLLLRIPIILGHRLPMALRPPLLSDLREGGRFLTTHGLATEAIDSAEYQPDGYWRGPMWAPPVYMAFDGLLDLGEFELAGDIARRFCRTCAAEPTAMFENYDVTSGRGLRCKAYSWTAAVFLRLASWLAQQRDVSTLTIQTTVNHHQHAIRTGH